MTPTRPTWAEVSRNRLLHNYRLLRDLAGTQTELLAVIKANAYGHGLADCARILAAEGAHWLGVTSVEEGVALRRICPQARILVMAGIFPAEAEAVVEHRLTPVLWEPHHLDWLEHAVRRHGKTAAPFPLHLEIDTGMSRQGADPACLSQLLDRLGPASPLYLEAVMTHYHSPQNPEATHLQERALAAAAHAVASRGLQPQFLSAGSSAALLLPNADDSATLAKQISARRMLRTGIALYGYAPCSDSANLQPVLSWKTRVVSLREIDAGTAVGYDATFTAQRPTRLALLPAGYADGLSRLLSNRGSVLLRGQRGPIAGRISMDHTTVDVTNIPGVSIGDEVILIGQQGGEKITAADLAQLTGTIPYEVLCGIAARVPRILVD